MQTRRMTKCPSSIPTTTISRMIKDIFAPETSAFSCTASASLTTAPAGWAWMIACYLLASRLRKYAEKFKFVDKLMSLSVYALVLLMGLRMGADEEVTSSPVAYPDPSVLERGEAFEELGIEATQTMSSRYNRGSPRTRPGGRGS